VTAKHPYIQKVETITAKTLRQALVNWRRGELAPEALLELNLIGDIDRDLPHTRDTALYDVVDTVTCRLIEQMREIQDVPRVDENKDKREAIFSQVNLDFNGSSEKTISTLAALSSIYYRYVIPQELSTKQLADAAKVSNRHFRRCAERGIRLVARRLRQIEYHASTTPQRDL